jgi:hypothetical protein
MLSEFELAFTNGAIDDPIFCATLLSRRERSSSKYDFLNSAGLFFGQLQRNLSHFDLRTSFLHGRLTLSEIKKVV